MLLTLPLLGALLLGPDPSFPTPAITSTVIRGDTIWFVGTRGYDSTAVAYCHVRSTSRWCRTSPPAGIGTEPAFAVRSAALLTPGAPLALGAGWSLDCEAAALDESSCDGTRWLNDVRGRRLPLSIPEPADAGSEGYAIPTGAPSAWAAHGGTVWLGLGGWSSEGMAERGGLVAADSSRGTVRHLTHEWLDHATVTSIAIDEGGLWIGTMHPGEYGDYGYSGLVRYEPAAGAREGRWSRVTAGQGALPGDLVRSVDASDGIVAVATDRGLAVRDPDGRWSRQYWRLALAGDTIVHELTADGPQSTDGPEALRFLALLDLGVPNQGEVLDAATRAGVELATLPVYALRGSDESALAVPALSGPLAAAVRRAPGGVHPGVITAVGLLGARDAVPALRTLLGDPSIDDDRATEVAIALVRMDDPAGREWLRTRLAAEPDPGQGWAPTDPRVTAARAAARLRDGESLAVIARLLRREILPEGVGQRNAEGPQPLDHHTGVALLEALAAYGTPEAWRAAVVATRVRPVLRGALLRSVDDSAVASDPELRAAIVREAVAAMADPRTQQDALRVATSVARDVRLVDAIVVQLGRGFEPSTFRDAVAALVSLTGMATAPHLAFGFDDAQAREAALFWDRWARGRTPDFAPVGIETGRDAWRRWEEQGLRRFLPPDDARDEPPVGREPERRE